MAIRCDLIKIIEDNLEKNHSHRDNPQNKNRRDLDAHGKEDFQRVETNAIHPPPKVVDFLQIILRGLSVGKVDLTRDNKLVFVQNLLQAHGVTPLQSGKCLLGEAQEARHFLFQLLKGQGLRKTDIRAELFHLLMILLVQVS